MVIFLLLLLSLLLLAPASAQCTQLADCGACLAASCAWCVSTKRCVPDEAWMCQGDTDHIGKLGRAQQCPSLEELASAARSRAAAAAAAQPEEDAAPAEQQPKRRGSAAAAAAAAAEWAPAGAAHLADLAQRAQRARSATAYGKTHPYATLGVPASATQREVHKAYKALATRLHPDRNPAHAKDAEAAFADVSAAHDLLSDQVAREAFDAEAAGGAAFFADEASFAASGQKYESVGRWVVAVRRRAPSSPALTRSARTPHTRCAGTTSTPPMAW